MKFKKYLMNESPKMGAIWGTGPDVRAYPKTGFSKDHLMSTERGTNQKNRSGFANHIENYHDPLDQRNRKFRKKSWLTGWSKTMQYGGNL